MDLRLSHDAAFQYIIEIKCPCVIRELSVREGWEKTEFLEHTDGQISLQRGHAYFYQIKWTDRRCQSIQVFFLGLDNKGTVCHQD